ncbi:MAG: hypothetical protein HOC72_14340 [Rhodospirillaceae bacterium]|nr:hypothetical protein [Rhodospirillaceae bacterium]
MAVFQLRLFGGFVLSGGDDTAVVLSSKKAAALLAYLAHHGDRPVSRAKLAALLWSDRGEAQARSSLRQTLSVLRKALGEPGKGVIRASAQELSIDHQAIAVDTAAFQSGSDPAAAELYLGPFLDGLDVRSPLFEEWLGQERARLAERAARAFTALLQQYQHDREKCLAYAAKLLALDPLREDMHRLVMHHHQQQGRWNEAIRQYQACRNILAAELAVEPEAETQNLYQEIMQQRDGAAPPAPAPIVPEPKPEPEPAVLRQDGQYPAIAVMPFDNLAGDPDQDYFADGITEDIITELSRFPDLFVVARNSTFSYKDRAFDLHAVSREFGVQYVLKGSVRKAGDQVRLTAQLLEAEGGKHIWAERYDRRLSDIFALQDELTRSIGAVLPGRLENFEARKAGQKPPGDMAAYELLLAGKVHHHRYTREDCATALDRLDRAIALEPGYAAAYAWKACVLGQALARGFLPDPDALFNSSVAAVGTALRLDEGEVEAHRVQAEISIVTKRLDAAVQHNERALSLNPNDPRLLAQKGELLSWSGAAGEALQWIEMAMRLDPYSRPLWAHLLGAALMQSERFEDAIEAYLQAAHPRFGHHADMAGCHGKLGRPEEAARQTALTLELKPDFTVSGYLAGLAYRHEKDRENHRAILATTPLPG